MLELERRKLDDVVLAGEHPRQPGLQLAATHRAQEPDPTEVDTYDRHAGSEEARERS